MTPQSEKSSQIPVVSGGESLARRLGDTEVYSPLWHRARALGLRDNRALLAAAVHRGARHYAGVVASSAIDPVSPEALSHEELVVLLLHGRNAFEPFLIRAAAELIRHLALDPARLADAARRERCQRVLSYVAQLGAAHDPTGARFWETLGAELGSQRWVPPGILPHWSRFVALHGRDRSGRDRGGHWIGAAA